MAVKPEQAVRRLRVHCTNITGAGADQLVRSLLPALIHQCEVQVCYAPASNPVLCDLITACKPTIQLLRFKRRLPNSVSRVVECLFPSQQFKGAGTLLVLGDLPLRLPGRQFVFVQQSLLVNQNSQLSMTKAIKFAVVRWLFKHTLKYTQGLIVQTQVMKSRLHKQFPEYKRPIEIVRQPVPNWLLGKTLKPKLTYVANAHTRLKAFYPACAYPHKNHVLLKRLYTTISACPMDVVLTITPEEWAVPPIQSVTCMGYLNPDEMIQQYQACDFVLFLSNEESFGFPLLEAMYLGLPIICPNLPYAHEMCEDSAIYFKPNCVDDLSRKMSELHQLLLSGWRPNYDEPLSKFPRDWQQVAEQFARIVTPS